MEQGRKRPNQGLPDLDPRVPARNPGLAPFGDSCKKQLAVFDRLRCQHGPHAQNHDAVPLLKPSAIAMQGPRRHVGLEPCHFHQRVLEEFWVPHVMLPPEFWQVLGPTDLLKQAFLVQGCHPFMWQQEVTRQVKHRSGQPSFDLEGHLHCVGLWWDQGFAELLDQGCMDVVGGAAKRPQ